MADKKKMGAEFAIIKPTHDIRLSKLLTSQAEAKKRKEATITLREFIAQEYPREFTDTTTAFKCTIKDMGLAPFEIDIYDARIIVVEVTGKMLSNNVPERIYKARENSITSALHTIGSIMAKRKIKAMDSTVITMRDFHNAYSSFYKYIATVVNPAYAKALDAIQDKLPFTQISEGRSDEEDWFTKKR